MPVLALDGEYSFGSAALRYCNNIPAILSITFTYNTSETFGRNKKQKEAIMRYLAQYIGGHPAYSKGFYITAEFQSDLLSLTTNNGRDDFFAIPYNTITGIENISENKFDADRIVSFGLVGLIKKKHIYTVIKTHAIKGQEIAMVLDFGPSGKIEQAQRILYEKMIEFGTKKVGLQP
jgi:hypothetical protein